MSFEFDNLNPTPLPKPDLKRTITAQEKLIVMLLSWLIPGYGFWFYGMRRRALFFFVTLELVFLIGAMFQGSVLLPDFNYRSEGFNILTLLTFATQMFNGALGLVSLLPDLGLRFHILPFNETSHWSDLGGIYLLVSGGMNYFVLASTYDHFYGRKRSDIAARAAVTKVED